jgi:tetratricopeptide (TPR) repeat protein
MKSRDYVWIMIVMVALLVGCGGEEDLPTPTSVPPTSTTAATPTLSAGDRVELGREYRDQGELDKAIAEFEEAIELDPNDAEAHRSLGTVYGELRKWEESAAALERAIELDPDFGPAYGDLTATYFHLGRIPEALEAGEKSTELAPDYGPGHSNLGVVYEAQGELDRAIAEYEKAIELDPSDSKPHNNLGIIYKERGDFEMAIAEYEKAIALDPSDPKPHNNLGNVYKQQGEFDMAIAEYEKALEIDPDYATAHASLGLLYAQQDMPEKAIAHFETYLELWPTAPNREQVEEWLAELRGQGSTYVNAEGGYSVPYPAGWYYSEQGTRVGLAESQEAYEASSLVSPLVTLLITPRAQAAQGFGLAESAAPTEFLRVMTERVKAEVEKMEEVEIVGYPAAVAATSGTTMGSPHRGDMIIILLEERLFLAEAIAPPDQWDAFRPTFVDMINGLAFFEPGGSGTPSVDFTDPVSVLQAVFTAAQTEDFSVLSGLCDPRGENDGDTAFICAITADHPDKDSFVAYFAKAKVVGDAVIDGDRAEIPFLFGPDGDQGETTMGLVKREGKWYLSDF